MTETTDTPQWRAIRDTALPITNSIVMRGAVIRAWSRPSVDFAPVGDHASNETPTRTEDYSELRPPQAGMYRSGTDASGNPKWSRHNPDTSSGATAAPLWTYRGENSPTIVSGELRRKGERWVSLDWPRDPDMQPANAAAEAVAAYFAAHADDALPALAWDEERHAVNAASEGAFTPSASAADEIPPRIYSRDPPGLKF